MIAIDHALIIKNAQTNIDQTAAALNYALTAMESMMALGFQNTHASIDDVSSSVETYGKDRALKPVYPLPSMDRMLGLTRSLLQISGDYNLELVKLFKAQLSEVSRSLGYLKDQKYLVTAYGGEGALAAVQEAVEAAQKAVSDYQRVIAG